MENGKFKADTKYLLDLVQLAQAVFRQLEETPVDDKMQLGHLKEVVLKLTSVLYAHDEELQSDFGQDFIEYALLKLEDDGTDPTGGVKRFGDFIEVALDELEERLVDSEKDK